MVVGADGGQMEDLEHIVNRPEQRIRINDFVQLNRHHLFEKILIWMQSPVKCKMTRFKSIKEMT